MEVNCYEAGAVVGQGVCWSADRTEAWELQAGESVRGMPLDEAAQIAQRIGLPPPYQVGTASYLPQGGGDPIATAIWALERSKRP